jgi:hypothetical protein
VGVLYVAIKFCDWLGDKLPDWVIVPLQGIAVTGFIWLLVAGFCYIEAVPK